MDESSSDASRRRRNKPNDELVGRPGCSPVNGVSPRQSSVEGDPNRRVTNRSEEPRRSRLGLWAHFKYPIPWHASTDSGASGSLPASNSPMQTGEQQPNANKSRRGWPTVVWIPPPRQATSGNCAVRANTTTNLALSSALKESHPALMCVILWD